MELTAPLVRGTEAIRTPALVIDLDAVEANLSATLRLLDGQASRWRPHLKTAKLELVMRRIRERDVAQAKVSTPLELETALRAGFTDVLLAHPVSGPKAAMLRRIADDFPAATVSALIEDAGMIADWLGSRISLFIDLNSGMDRTGTLLDPGHVVSLAQAIVGAGLRFAGLHCYDGHAAGFEPTEAERRVHEGYDRVLTLVEQLGAAGLATPEVITAGTPAFPHAMSYRGFARTGTLHRVSPGTVVYNDRTSLRQLPLDAGYRPAALVLSTVVSHPGTERFCADAGHKSVSADAGVPTCSVLGYPQYLPRQPSEEHLPIDVPPGAPLPGRGQTLWLLPSHVCPTVNNFDYAVIVSGGAVQHVERVTARGRHPPLDAVPAP